MKIAAPQLALCSGRTCGAQRIARRGRLVCRVSRLRAAALEWGIFEPPAERERRSRLLQSVHGKHQGSRCVGGRQRGAAAGEADLTAMRTAGKLSPAPYENARAARGKPEQLSLALRRFCRPCVGGIRFLMVAFPRRARLRPSVRRRRGSATLTAAQGKPKRNAGASVAASGSLRIGWRSRNG